MTRLVLSVFGIAIAVSFHACEGHDAKMLPEHYQHKMHHGDAHATPNHPPSGHPEKGGKDPNQKHDEVAIPENPAAKPGANPHKTE